MIKIIFDGRIDIDDYFKKSGVFDSESLKHTPFLVFIGLEDTIRVQIINKP